MKRYHRKIYFPHLKEIETFTENLNQSEFSYSKHCLDNIKYRLIDIEKTLYFIKYLKLNSESAFEYYKGDIIEKVCYRVEFNNMALILVISKDKKIITLYINSQNDNHETLKENLYART